MFFSKCDIYRLFLFISKSTKYNFYFIILSIVCRKPNNIKLGEQAADCRYAIDKRNITRIYPFKTESYSRSMDWMRKPNFLKERVKVQRLLKKEVADFNNMGELFSTEVFGLDETFECENPFSYNPQNHESFLDLMAIAKRKKQGDRNEKKLSSKRKNKRAMKQEQADLKKTHNNIKYVDPPFAARNFDTVRLNEKYSEKLTFVNYNFPTEQINPERLNERYGDFYTEGETFPRRFLITKSNKEATSSKIIAVVESELEGKVIVKIVFKGFPDDFDFTNMLQVIKTENDIAFDTVIDMFYPDIVIAAQKPDVVKNPSFISQPVETKSATDVLVESDLFRNKERTTNGSDNLQTINNKECLNCLESGKEFVTAKRCLHSFCKACWKMYIVSKITEEFSAEIKCMAFDCNISIDSVSILSMVSWKNFCSYLSAFQKQLIRSSKNLQSCPNESCGGVVVVNDPQLLLPSPSARCNKSAFANTLPVTCKSCLQSWCFSCRKNNHWPLSCQTYGKFKVIREKFINIDASGRPVKTEVYGKHCPYCGCFVEKYGGCNVMMCICSTEYFCWACTRPIDEHISMNGKCPSSNFLVEEQFVPSYTSRELKLFSILQNHNPSGNRELQKLLRKRIKGRRVKGYATVKNSINVLKKSIDILVMINIAVFVNGSRSVPLLFKTGSRRLRFTNTLLLQTLEHGVESDCINTIEIDKMCGDISNILFQISRSL